MWPECWSKKLYEENFEIFFNPYCLHFWYEFPVPSLLSYSYCCLTCGTGWIREKDPSRLVHYEGGGSRTDSTDIVCPMYMRIWDIVKIALDKSESRPLILCEYVISVSLDFSSFFFRLLSISPYSMTVIASPFRFHVVHLRDFLLNEMQVFTCYG